MLGVLSNEMPPKNILRGQNMLILYSDWGQGFHLGVNCGEPKGFRLAIFCKLLYTSVMIIHSMSNNLTVRQSFDRSRVYTVQGEMPKDLVQTEKHKVFFSFM